MNRVKRSIFNLGFDSTNKISYFCNECLARLIKPDQPNCVHGCSLNDRRRSFSNVAELLINNVEEEIKRTAENYLELINGHSLNSDQLLKCDILGSSIYRRITRYGRSKRLSSKSHHRFEITRTQLWYSVPGLASHIRTEICYGPMWLNSYTI